MIKINKVIIKNNIKFIILCFVVLLISFFGAKKFLFSSKNEPFKTAKVLKEDINFTITASGKIKSDEEAILRFSTIGRLAWVGVKKGDQVQKWQTIASLDKNELQKKLNQELLDYMNERWDYEQINLDDYRDQALTETIRRVKDKSQFDLDRTVLDVEIVDIALKYASIFTPIDGIVTQIDFPNPGVTISLTDKVIIANPNKLIFSANVDEGDIGKVKAGFLAKIIFDAYPDETLILPIEQIDFTPTLTSGGGTAYGCKFLLPENINEKYKLEMNGDAEILIEQKKDVLTIPQEAIREDNQDQYVWVLSGDKPQKQTIKTGLATGLQTEVLEGLEENTIIITSNFKSLENNGKK